MFLTVSEAQRLCVFFTSTCSAIFSCSAASLTYWSTLCGASGAASFVRFPVRVVAWCLCLCLCPCLSLTIPLRTCLCFCLCFSISASWLVRSTDKCTAVGIWINRRHGCSPVNMYRTMICAKSSAQNSDRDTILEVNSSWTACEELTTSLSCIARQIHKASDLCARDRVIGSHLWPFATKLVAA